MVIVYRWIWGVLIRRKCEGVNLRRNISFVYPFGATINVQKPAIPILSSGSTSYPFNRPIGACYVNPVFA